MLFTEPHIERYFMRCLGCGRILPHYRGCVTAEDRQKGHKIGCRCGGVRSRICVVPVWQGLPLLLWCYLWRKCIKGYTFWDPRMPAKREPQEAA